jgi:hypothetical protein
LPALKKLVESACRLSLTRCSFGKVGAYSVACSVQDDQGGERTVMQTIQVE